MGELAHERAGRLRPPRSYEPRFGREEDDAISVTGHVTDVGELIAALQGTLDTRSARDTAVIGHSRGAIVALHWAAQSSEAIGGLAFLGIGRVAGHISAARQCMSDLASAVRSKGIAFAADVAKKWNFDEET